MTFEEMKSAIIEECEKRKCCDGCPLFKGGACFSFFDDKNDKSQCEKLRRNYELMFGVNPITTNKQPIETKHKTTIVVKHDDRKIKMVKTVDGNVVAKSKACCHKNDVFNEQYGIELAYSRLLEENVLNNIKVGDKIKIIKTMYKFDTDICVVTHKDKKGNLYITPVGGKKMVGVFEHGAVPHDNCYVFNEMSVEKFEKIS